MQKKEIRESLEKQPVDYQYAKIHDNEIWRFYIDGYRQETVEGKKLGDQVFDKDEPGYINAMLNAHAYLNKTLNRSLTPELIIKLHDYAVKGVEGIKRDTKATDNAFRLLKETDHYFGVKLNVGYWGEPNLGGNVSINGLEQFFKEIIENKGADGFSIGDIEDSKTVPWPLYNQALQEYQDNGNMEGQACLSFIDYMMDGKRLIVPRKDRTWIKEKMIEYIAHYEDSLTHAQTTDEKLDAISTVVQKLERLHPFDDGNCRTLCMLILNRELIRNGFPPAMLENPNRFDLFSITELREEIKKGWEQAEKYQSKIASLPEFEALYKQVNESPHTHAFFSPSETDETEMTRKLLQRIKSQPLDKAIEILDTHNSKRFDHQLKDLQKAILTLQEENANEPKVRR